LPVRHSGGSRNPGCLGLAAMNAADAVMTNLLLA